MYLLYFKKVKKHFKKKLGLMLSYAILESTKITNSSTVRNVRISYRCYTILTSEHCFIAVHCSTQLRSAAESTSDFVVLVVVGKFLSKMAYAKLCTMQLAGNGLHLCFFAKFVKIFPFL